MQHNPGYDIRKDIFGSIADHTVTATIVADADGVIAEIDVAVRLARDLQLNVLDSVSEGYSIEAGDRIISVSGTAMQVAIAEDRLIGCIAKPSGIATAARRFVRASGELTLVSGAWKKMPLVLKEPIRRAAAVGGAEVRISRTPFLYLDKNYVRMFGGLLETMRAVQAVESLKSYRRVVQVCGLETTVGEEAILVAKNGADIIFVDTGRVEDLVEAGGALRDAGLRVKVELAFGGGVSFEMLDVLQRCDVDMVDIGRPIIDAPLLDMHLVAERAVSGGTL